jgi:transketolase
MSLAPTNITDLQTIARQLRGKILEMSHRAGTPHLGSSLSCVDILVAAYWGVANVDPKHPDAPDRDRVILSKGHAAPALYAALAYRGFFPKELLDTYTDAGGKLAEHPGPHCVPGVEWATGSLGHGLPVALGMALAGRIQGRRYQLFVIMSDGECEEGSVWEAAMFAPIHKLDNLTIIVDYNKWQATGRTNEVMAMQPLRQKWEAFGWDACEVDGHNIAALLAALRAAPAGKPRAIIAHTVKGKGVSFMEDDNNWHYRAPNADELQRARKELGLE